MNKLEETANLLLLEREEKLFDQKRELRGNVMAQKFIFLDGGLKDSFKNHETRTGILA